MFLSQCGSNRLLSFSPAHALGYAYPTAWHSSWRAAGPPSFAISLNTIQASSVPEPKLATPISLLGLRLGGSLFGDAAFS